MQVEHGFWRRFVDAPAHEVDVALKDLMRVTWATIGPSVLLCLCQDVGYSLCT